MPDHHSHISASPRSDTKRRDHRCRNADRRPISSRANERAARRSRTRDSCSAPSTTREVDREHAPASFTRAPAHQQRRKSLFGAAAPRAPRPPPTRSSAVADRDAEARRQRPARGGPTAPSRTFSVAADRHRRRRELARRVRDKINRAQRRAHAHQSRVDHRASATDQRLVLTRANQPDRRAYGLADGPRGARVARALAARADDRAPPTRSSSSTRGGDQARSSTTPSPTPIPGVTQTLNRAEGRRVAPHRAASGTWSAGCNVHAFGDAYNKAVGFLTRGRQPTGSGASAATARPSRTARLDALAAPRAPTDGDALRAGLTSTSREALGRRGAGLNAAVNRTASPTGGAPRRPRGRLRRRRGDVHAERTGVIDQRSTTLDARRPRSATRRDVESPARQEAPALPRRTEFESSLSDQVARATRSPRSSRGCSRGLVTRRAAPARRPADDPRPRRAHAAPTAPPSTRSRRSARPTALRAHCEHQQGALNDGDADKLAPRESHGASRSSSGAPRVHRASTRARARGRPRRGPLAAAGARRAAQEARVAELAIHTSRSTRRARRVRRHSRPRLPPAPPATAPHDPARVGPLLQPGSAAPPRRPPDADRPQG
jgi:hypothetical protein